MEISFPAAATPMTVETPQPLWHASSADRITSTWIVKLKGDNAWWWAQLTPGRRVKRKVESAIFELNEVVLNTFARNLRGLINSVAPNLRAHSSFTGFTSMAITRDASTSLAALMQLRPTQPQPKTATVEPSAVLNTRALIRR